MPSAPAQRARESLPGDRGARCGRLLRWALMAPMTLMILPAVCWSQAQAVPLADDDLLGDAALALIAARSELSGQDLWPGFDPLDYPLAVFDGVSTVLVDHPAPPPEFEALAAVPGVVVMAGRHGQVNANSSIELGGVDTATLMLDSLDPQDPMAAVAVAAHEAFHVFQGLRFPGWVADESQLFLYPVDDARLLALRRSESLAWRRALLVEDGLPWAALALDLRRQLNGLRSDGAVGYERGLELKEGLARYVQDRCLPERRPAAAPAGGWPAEVVRQRAYVTGATMAHLLDRCAPAWKEHLAEQDGAFLDDLLGRALARLRVVPGVFSTDELQQVETTAAADAAAVATSRSDERAAYLAQAGSSLAVRVGGGRPLSPQGFDPLNVRSLGGRDVLHTRWLQLQREDAEITVDGCSVLTQGAGSHPLFGGVRELLLTGLAERPVVEERHAETLVSAPGFAGRFVGAAFERRGELLIITLP